LRCAPTYLCRVFSEHTGVGPHAYQLQQRLLEAGRLIEGGRSVAKAATLTGFGDASHLRRHFHRRFAAAPGRYQRELAPEIPGRVSGRVVACEASAAHGH
jgi:transcriptional regulator GlxA family with amidase domain